MGEKAKVRLVDPPEEAGRTTATLFSSLAARLVVLHYTSGVSVVGSTLVGLAEAGREISQTAEGARLRRAIEQSTASANGETVWKALRIAEWTSGMPASPVLDHVRNDLALLLADDLDEVVANVPVPQETEIKQRTETPEDLNFIDTMMGLWVYSREIVRSLEALAEHMPQDGNRFEEGDDAANGAILR